MYGGDPGRAVLALDVGGTKLDAALVLGDGTVVARDRRPTAGADEADLLSVVLRLLDGVAASAEHDGAPAPVAVGIGCGGPMHDGGALVSPLNIPQWRDFPLRDRVSAHLGIEAHLDNDAKALALGEGWCGAAVGERDYLAMVVSTGVGAGIVVDGRLLDGSSGNAGHLGHVVVDPLGRECPCGSRGCLEAQVSGTAIAAATGAPAAEARTEVRAWSGRLVGRAVASAAVLLDLRLAVVAGSVALGYGASFFDAARAEADRLARIGYARGVRIEPTGCGGDGPLIGAAAVALRAMQQA